MVSTQQVQDLLTDGGTVLSEDGSKIGKVEQVFLDDETSEPEWVTVKTGMFGGAETFVPLQDARVDGDEVTVPFSKDKVKDAPRIEDQDGHLSREEESELYRYYGIAESSSSHHDTTTQQDTDLGSDRSDGGGGVDREDRDDDGRTDSRDGMASGVLGDDTDSTRGAEGASDGSDGSDGSMTRSEERVNIGTETESAGKVRLRKYVVTDEVTKTVPVSHEEVRVERVPLEGDEADTSSASGELAEETAEVELSGERVVVDKDTVPVEKVQLDRETVTEDQQVTEEVRKEQIDVDDEGHGAEDGHDSQGVTDENRSDLR